MFYIFKNKIKKKFFINFFLQMFLMSGELLFLNVEPINWWNWGNACSKCSATLQRISCSSGARCSSAKLCCATCARSHAGLRHSQSDSSAGAALPCCCKKKHCHQCWGDKFANVLEPFGPRGHLSPVDI